MDISRRDIFTVGGKLLILASVGATLEQITGAEPPSDAYRMADHWWGMIVDIDKCIGCGNCVRACSKENNVPEGYFRTWVERYQIEEGKQPHVESPKGAIEGFPPLTRTDLKSFFVPKLCNHCVDSPCVQVCPGGRHLRQPGWRRAGGPDLLPGMPLLRAGLSLWLPLPAPAKRKTVDKCTLCYHRITKGLTTACCENCPTGARLLVDFKNPKDPVHEILRTHKVQVLKPYMATGAKVYYENLDGEVR